MREGELWGKVRDKGNLESARWVPVGGSHPSWATIPAWFRAGWTRDVWLSAVTTAVGNGLQRRAVRSSSLKTNVLPRFDSIPHPFASKPILLCFLFLRKEAAVNTHLHPHPHPQNFSQTASLSDIKPQKLPSCPFAYWESSRLTGSVSPDITTLNLITVLELHKVMLCETAFAHAKIFFSSWKVDKR